MKQNRLFVQNIANFFNRLNYTRFIVSMHNANNESIITQSSYYILHINSSRSLRSYVFNIETMFFQMFRGVYYRLMLDRCSNNMLLSCLLCILNQSLQHHIITFSSTTGKKNLIALHSKKICNLLSTSCYNLTCIFSVIMCSAISITISSMIRINHHFQHTRIYWCRSIIVKIYSAHFSS